MKLKDCISNSIKKQEKEYKEQKKKAEKEREEKIKTIKHFFSEILPRYKEFMFEPVQAPFKKIYIEKKLLTIEIYTPTDLSNIPWFSMTHFGMGNLHIDLWHLKEIGWVYDNLPWFESELRRKFGC